ncbi:MAG TPA: electron transport complex subunit E [bacterium]|nr:electron transport complex subunit E [bacterium]
MSTPTFRSELTRGFWRENPIFVIVLGTCPTLAVSTSLQNAVGMGLAVTFVTACSNALVAMLRGIIPNKIRIPCFIVVAATFVTITDLFMHAFTFPLWQALGIFIPLIVVNCIILGRAEAYAYKNTVWHATADGIGMGLGFTLALCAIASIREVLGNGTLWNVPLFGDGFQPILIFILAPGAFFVFGSLMAISNWLKARQGGAA